MNENTDKVDHILHEIRHLKNKHEVLAAATGEDFNVFSILRIKHRETITHTPVLSELLNPDGSHHQKDAFLKLFLEVCIKNADSKNADSGNSDFYNPKDYQVRSEERVDQAQFDIRLEKKGVCCIVIENKIYAQDQDSQLKRLYEDAHKDFRENQIKLVYLTLDGSPPSKASLEDLNPDNVQRISYREHIILWLEECMKLEAVQRIASIREILFQYRNLLKDLTGQPTNTSNIMELSNPLTKDENYELIPQLEQALLELKVQSQISFWEELRDQLVNRNMKEIIEEKSLEYYVCHYYKGKQGRGFSWCFEIDKWWKQSKIALAIEIAPSIENDTNRIFYGFSLLQGREWVHPCNNDNSLAEKLPDNGYKRTNDWYIGWKYPKNKLRFPLEYREPDDKKFLFLLDEEKRGEAVQKLAEEIAEEVDEFKKNLVHCTVYSSQHRFAINSRENLPYGDCMKPVCGQLHCFLQD